MTPNPYDSMPDVVAEWRQAFTEFTPGVSDLGLFREVVARSADKVAHPHCEWTPDGAQRLYEAALRAASPWSRWWHRQAVRLSRQRGARCSPAWRGLWRAPGGVWRRSPQGRG